MKVDRLAVENRQQCGYATGWLHGLACLSENVVFAADDLNGVFIGRSSSRQGSSGSGAEIEWWRDEVSACLQPTAVKSSEMKNC